MGRIAGTATGVAVALVVAGCTSGSDASPSSPTGGAASTPVRTVTTTVTTTPTVTVTPTRASTSTAPATSPTRPANAALPVLSGTRANGAGVAALLGSAKVPDPWQDDCRVVLVFGADLAARDLDVYVGIVTEGILVKSAACGGDTAGTFYRIRGGRVTDQASACGDCGTQDSNYASLTAPYGKRPDTIFAPSRSGGTWALVPANL